MTLMRHMIYGHKCWKEVRIINIVEGLKTFLGINNEMEKKISISEINAMFGHSITGEFGKDISIITYYICLKTLSESMGKMTIKLKDINNKDQPNHETMYALTIRPNKYMTPTNFKQFMEYSRNHYGNAYAYIERNGKGEVVALHPLSSDRVNIYVNNTDLYTKRPYYYQYLEMKSGKMYWYDPEDVIHLRGGLSENMYSGKSVRETLAATMDGEKASQKFLNDLYSRGLTANAVVKYVGDFDASKQKELVKRIMQFGGKSTDKIIPMPIGFDLVPLDLKLSDSQFYELKKFSSLQIAAAFGVKPNHINNYEKSSYNNSELQNLTFYIDTLLFIIKSWEEELNYKLLTSKELKEGLRFNFNVASILRGDLKSQAEVLAKYTSHAIYTVNEARHQIGLPNIHGGDKALVNGSYTPIEDAGKVYQKGGEEN